MEEKTSKLANKELPFTYLLLTFTLDFLYFSIFIYHLTFSEGTASYCLNEEISQAISENLASGNLEELDKHYQKGWRLHHENKDKKYWLTTALRCDNQAVVLSKYLTVSEAALVAVGEDGKTNAEILLENEAAVIVLAKNYNIEYGFEVKNDVLINAFLTAEKNSSKKENFTLLRAAFGIKKKDEATPEKKDEAKKDEADGKHEEKNAEVKNEAEPESKKEAEPEVKNDEVKPEEGDAPKQGDEA